jgi:phosphoribosylcarboxyaminoimidazole (NCAIR) mutase
MAAVKEQPKRRIGIMIGSDSDLPQCLPGLLFLQEAEIKGLAQVNVVITNSIHRNTEEVLLGLRTLTQEKGQKPVDRVNIWIIGAGCANHLTGTCDAYLRYYMENNLVPVIGVAFENSDPNKTLAAILSIEAVPGTQVIFARNRHVGGIGFANACHDAIHGDIPKLKIPPPKKVEVRTLSEAIAAGEEKAKK